MGTVLANRYRLICGNCGLDAEFLLGASLGTVDAVEKARRIHANDAQERGCDEPGKYLIVTILKKWEPRDPQTGETP